MLTNQKQIRDAFWQAFPDLPRRRYRYSPKRDDKCAFVDFLDALHRDGQVAAPLVYPVDTRCAFVDFLDALHRDGQVSDALANRATL
jgi:hypothetical protein